VVDSRELPARPSCLRGARVPREPVFLGAGGHVRSCRQVAPSTARRLSRHHAPTGTPEQRRRRQSRPDRPPDRRRQAVRRRHDAFPRLHALPARSRREAGLRPLEGRGDRRRLADHRLGEPELALVLQRHRGERRRPRPGAGAGSAAEALGGAPRAAARGDRRRPGARVRRTVEAARRGAAGTPPQ
jgi:hypothetical protein